MAGRRGGVNIGRIKALKVTTGRGKAVYPRLNKPDTKFKDEGEYSIKVKLEGDEAVEFQRRYDEYFEKAHAAAEENAGRKLKCGVNSPIKPFVDEDGSEVPGAILVAFKMKASGRNREGDDWKQSPIVVDRAKRKITELVGGGSLVRVSGLLVPYFTAALGFGISAKLKAVQVLELVGAGGDFTSDFDDESDGEEEEREEQQQDDDPEDADDEGDGEDF